MLSFYLGITGERYVRFTQNLKIILRKKYESQFL